MRIAIMQPYFFPYIGYFQLINAVDVFVIYDDVNYIKKGWINKNKILVNGQSNFIQLQIEKVSQNKHINTLYLTDNVDAKNDFLTTVSMAYKRAPYFEKVYNLILKIIFYEERNLALYLSNLLKEIALFLEINTQFINSSEIEKNTELKGERKIIEICKALNTDNYINAIGGKELYNLEHFSDQKIKLNFIKTNNIVYSQFENEFIPWLSIIDVMMFNSKQKISAFLNHYELE